MTTAHRHLGGSSLVELVVEQVDVVDHDVDVVVEDLVFEVVVLVEVFLVQLGFFFEFFVAHRGSERRPGSIAWGRGRGV